MSSMLFVDHAFHKRTRSSDFFIDILRNEFSISVFYVNPSEKIDYDIIEAARNVSYVLIWQMDFLAPIFIAMGKSTIVVPMYDGSILMPDLHWKISSRARFLNFSKALHERVRLLGCNTKLIRYYPEPVPERDIVSFANFNAFFWQRRPDHGVDYAHVVTLLSREVSTLHVHNVPDTGAAVPVPPPEGNFSQTVSTWFESRQDYENILNSCNVFVAPRVAEGIGMATLEAMARGMLVIAHDAPTANEYISNWVNGILFNKDTIPEPLRFGHEAKKLARCAWQSVGLGRSIWISSIPSIIDWIKGAVAAPPSDLDPRILLRDIWFNYFDSLDSYDLYLRRSVVEVSKLSGQPLGDLVDLLAAANPVVRKGSMKAVEFDLLPEEGLVDLLAEECRYLGQGWSYAERDLRWVEGIRSEIHFSEKLKSGESKQLRFEAYASQLLSPIVRCTLQFNGTFLGAFDVRPHWETYSINIPCHLIKERNTITFIFDNAVKPDADNRSLSVAFRWVKIDEIDETSPPLYPMTRANSA